MILYTPRKGTTAISPPAEELAKTNEATSSVDPENEQALLSAIHELTKDKTLISIAHRLSTVENADQIIIIDQGEIVQQGTHHELIQVDGIYKNFLELRSKAVGWQI